MGYITDIRRFVGSKPLIMVGANVVVLNDNGEILLQKRTDSLDWGTIGGSMELGESFEETAERELFEEAGLKASYFKPITTLSGKDMYYKYPHGDEIYNVMMVFEAQGIQGTPKINDDEGLELAYFPLDKPIAGINPFSELILRKTGYIK